MSGPVDYSLCCQTVTVYRRTEEGIQRTVIPGCYLQWQEELDEDGIRIRDEHKFLLIQPGENPIYPGDRIFDGEGPILTVQDWEGFLPVRVPGLSETAYAQPWYWQDKLCHWEAGRK